MLIAPKLHDATYLIDKEGAVVHSWKHSRNTAMVAYLLPNGNLLHTVYPSDPESRGCMVEELDWDGELVWEYKTGRNDHRMHHDIERLPNGNTLIIVWEEKDLDACLAAGRDPSIITNDVLWVDAVHEVKPTGEKTGKVVWRWSPWDHLVQNYDPTAPHYGVIAAYPDRIDINQTRLPKRNLMDWLHTNSVDYHPERDEMILSVHGLSEMWVVSRKTGRLVYRWGSPATYGQSAYLSRELYIQHDTHWIERGLPGEGNILIFNNGVGLGRKEGQYSEVIEIRPPLGEQGRWPAPTARGYPDSGIVWRCSGDKNSRFYSSIVSGAQRLRNGNTLICVGNKGTLLEVAPDGEEVWRFVNPVQGKGAPPRGLGGRRRPAANRSKNLLFRAYHYAPDYPAFMGRELARKKHLAHVAARENRK